MKKICVITGTRAEYGLLKTLMKKISLSGKLELQVVVTGMHLSPEFGFTFNEILDDDIVIDKKVEILVSSDTPNGITSSIGLGFIGFANAFSELKPDLILVLGDRYEIFAAVSSAMIFQFQLLIYMVASL